MKDSHSASVAERDGTRPQWGPTPVPNDQMTSFSFGPLRLEVDRRKFEWRVHAIRTPNSNGPPTSLRWNEPDPTLRFTTSETNGELTWKPALADRAVVARPETPVYVLAGDTASLYISTPLWVQCFVRENSDLPLHEFASVLLSDTWFGDLEGDGELCYAARTNARTLAESTLRKPTRALTPVHVRNRGKKNLLVQRIKLPLPFLRLYIDDHHVLWTDPLRLVAADDGTIEVEPRRDAPPQEAVSATLIAGARNHSTGNVVTRTLGALLR
ncbi:MAG: hypothetical protein ACI81R_001862 [Bradymonadia bacterium]|jgi:hypothetical protein